MHSHAPSLRSSGSDVVADVDRDDHPELHPEAGPVLGLPLRLHRRHGPPASGSGLPALLRRHAAHRPPDGLDPRPGRAHPPYAGRRSQHRTAPRPGAAPRAPLTAATDQNLCARTLGVELEFTTVVVDEMLRDLGNPHVGLPRDVSRKLLELREAGERRHVCPRQLAAGKHLLKFDAPLRRYRSVRGGGFDQENHALRAVDEYDIWQLATARQAEAYRVQLGGFEDEFLA